MGKGDRGKKAWCGKRQRAKEAREKRDKPGKIPDTRGASRRESSKSGTEEFLPLDQVKGLKAATKRFLRERAFYKARFNPEFGVYEATNEAGTMIIRGGQSPDEWQRV
jgi:hypothetical protein